MSSISELTGELEPLVPLVAIAPVVRHLDAPALNLSLDLPLHSLLRHSFILKVKQFQIQLVLGMLLAILAGLRQTDGLFVAGVIKVLWFRII